MVLIPIPVPAIQAGANVVAPALHNPVTQQFPNRVKQYNAAVAYDDRVAQQKAFDTAKADAVKVAETPVYGGLNSGVLSAIKMCESGGNYANNDTGGNGHYGAYQFSPGTWASVGGTGNPANASAAEQDMRAQILFNRSGTSPWLASISCWG